MPDIVEQLDSYASHLASAVPAVTADEVREPRTSSPSAHRLPPARRTRWEIGAAVTIAIAVVVALLGGVAGVFSDRAPLPGQHLQTVSPISPVPPAAAVKWGQAVQVTFGEGATWVALSARPGASGLPTGPGGVVRVTATGSGLASAPWVEADKLSGAVVGFGSLWTMGFGGNSVTRSDARTGRVQAVIALIPPPGSDNQLFLTAALATTDTAVWVITGRGHAEQIDPRNNAASAPITMAGNFPQSIVGAGPVAWTARGLDGVTRLDGAAGPPLSVKLHVGDHPASPTVVAYGQGRLWVAGVVLQKSSNTLSPEDTGFVASLDPRSGRLLNMTPVDLPVGGLAVTADAVWVRTWSGLLLSVKPNGPVTAVHTDVGAGVVLIAGGDGFMWVARADGSLARVDPRTGQVVAVRLISPPPRGWLDIAPAPAGVVSGDGAVWAGSEMVVLGGPGSSAAAAYHPDTDSWTELPAVPGGGRSKPLLGWTGREVLVWGGTGADHRPRADGVAYDPGTNRWRDLAPAPASLTTGIATVWTGNRLVVWGGTSSSPAGQTNLAGAASYDPVADRWQLLAAPPVALSYASGVWTGHQAIFWGGVVVNRDANTFIGTDGASYDPATGRWHRLPPSGLDAQASPAAWDGHELVAWSYGLTARAYDPVADAWRTLATPPLQAGECYSEALATSLGVFAWYCEQAARYERSGRWVVEPKPTIDGGVPVWTGRSIILWGLPPAATATSTGAMLTPAPPALSS